MIDLKSKNFKFKINPTALKVFVDLSHEHYLREDGVNEREKRDR